MIEKIKESDLVFVSGGVISDLTKGLLNSLARQDMHRGNIIHFETEEDVDLFISFFKYYTKDFELARDLKDAINMNNKNYFYGSEEELTAFHNYLERRKSIWFENNFICLYKK